MTGRIIAGDRKGITLLEILIAVAIVGILATLAVSTFREMNEKYKVEEETKQLYADLMDVRGRAMQRSRFSFVRMTGTGYATYEDTNPAPDGNGIWDNNADTQVTSVRVHHEITTDLASGMRFDFNRNGIATDNGTILLSSTVKPDYDCITIKSTRLKMGQYDAATDTCVEK